MIKFYSHFHIASVHIAVSIMHEELYNLGIPNMRIFPCINDARFYNKSGDILSRENFLPTNCIIRD